jgi:NAD(P)H-nitrite reductase large subunit
MKVVIIGNGIAGSTAALELRKISDSEILMVSDESIFPFSRPALMYIFMGHLGFENTKLQEDDYWKRNKIELINDSVSELNLAGKFIKLQSGNVTNYDKLVIATGSKPNKFGWPGQDLPGVQGLYHLKDLNMLEQAYKGGLKHAIIIGGGLIGIEVAEMFHSRDVKVTMVVRETSFWNNVLPDEESAMINRQILRHGINLMLESELATINGASKVESVTLKNGVILPCELVVLTVGVSPQITLVKDTDIAINKGIKVNNFLHTSHKDIYAIGDCAEIQDVQPKRKPIEAVWYTAKEMGRVVAENIVNNESVKYNPGIWYNSAKFFDIDYQIYGTVPTDNDPTMTSLYWEHPQGEKSIRIVYENATMKVVGFNLMGIRYRQNVCTEWIDKGASLEQVLQQLSLANFDPEFFEQYEDSLVSQYNQMNNTSIKNTASRNLSMVNKFLSKIKSYAQS